MPPLKILPGNLANMIAAGEVVQRPASVVKELMENSIDAGATSVTVVITDAGRTLIQVIDNGCGMSPDDALLCFERHATSKISTAEDLNDILTYGFRGEALPSISSVAEVTLKTRRPSDETATQVRVTAYNHVETSQVSAPAGTSFAVRNLFYNTPARRKFLKSDNVELKHIIEEFTRVAITRPDVSFSLSHNGRDIFVLKAAKSLKYRIVDILGSGVVGDLIDIEMTTSILRITGFVGRPDTARKSVGNQFFFANGRFFRSAYLNKAVMKAYEDFIPEGVNPSYFLYIDIDPHFIDVNIHPTKTEIKFEDDSLVFQTIYACIKETLGKNSFGGSIDFEAESSPVKMPVFSSNFDQFHPVSAPVIEFDPNFNPFDDSTSPSSAASVSAVPANTGTPRCAVRPDQDYGRLFEERTLSTTRTLVIQEKYILSPVKSGLMIINARRAQERIMYDQFLRALSGNEAAGQASLFPVQVNVGVENRLLFDSYSEILREVGFDISPFGNDTIVVNAVPEGYSPDAGKVQTMVFDLLLILSDGGTTSLREMLDSSMALKLAKLGASSAKPVSSPLEAQNLIDSLLSCENAEFTAGGQRIISILSAEEIEKRF